MAFENKPGEMSDDDKEKTLKNFEHLDEIYRHNQAEYDDLDSVPHESGFRRYLKKGQLQPSDCQKTIFDLGCGDGDFIKYALDRHYGSNLYGLDKDIDLQKMPKEYQSHFKKGDFSQEIPFEGKSSLILYSASIEQMAMKGQEQEIKQSLKLALEKLTPDGQIKIFPLRSNPQIYYSPERKKISPEEQKELFKEVEKMKQARILWDTILEELQKEGLIEYQIMPADFETRGPNDLYWLEEVLIITQPKKTKK